MPQTNALPKATETTLQDVRTSVQLIDDTVYTDGTGTPSKGLGIVGSDGTNPQFVKTDTDGNLQVDILSGSVTATITGVATEAKQDTQITSLQLLDDAVATTGAAITAKGMAVSGTDGTNARVLKTDTNGELQVDVLSMPTTTVTASYSTRADAYTAAASGTTIDVSTSPRKYFSIQVVGTGATATSWTVFLEGSLDNVNFTTLIEHTNASGHGVLFASAGEYPVLYIRSRCSAVVLGGASDIVAHILATQ